MEAVRTPQLWRSGQLAGEEQALVNDMTSLAMMDARLDNGGAEPNREQIEVKLEQYGIDPATFAFTGSQEKMRGIVEGLRAKWATRGRQAVGNLDQMRLRQHRLYNRTQAADQAFAQTDPAGAAQQQGLRLEVN
jgi:hypothetical protein